MARIHHVSTAYWNKVEAWKDWQRMAQAAIDAGRAELAEKHRPDLKASWRQIDQCTDRIRKALEAAK